MRHRWAALSLVLALCCVPEVLSAQGPGSRQTGGQGGLRQNYPNPFNPETRIPFSIGDEACQDPGKTYRTTLRIYNLLSQVVAIPVLQGGSGSVAGGQSLENVPLSCGAYTAYWDGKYRGTAQEVASGIYFYQLIIDGKVVDSRKMLVTK
jgi:hypothetical protein